LSIEQRVTLSLNAANALNTEELFLAGGQVFNLGPAGAVISSNLTSDEETGIGRYTDEELETLLRLGVKPDGTMLHRIMPYSSYVNWAADDMAALIAYLRSIPAIANDVGESTILRDEFEGDAVEALSELEFPEESPSVAIERGEYLVVNVMRCTGCHTPRDPETGQPDNNLYLGGGQAYEGEWGIVYGSNISPDADTGIGAWSDQDIEQVLHEGVRIDGRHLVFMPWQDFASISDEDVITVIAYLRSIDPIDNEVPLPAINDDFFQFVETDG
jgi:mono/diheme cytochrome c family protein